MGTTGTFSYDGRITGDDEADGLLAEDPAALLIGMLLDQQMPMERAFVGPARLRDRLGHLDVERIAAMDAHEFEEVFRESPAIHRFPGSMAGRVQDLCAAILEDHGGDAAAVWRDVEDATELRRRLRALPGFGPQKTQVFVALLAKRCGVAPSGWEDVAGEYATADHRSVADVVTVDDVALVREAKRAAKRGG